MKHKKIWDKKFLLRVIKIGLPVIFTSMIFAITSIIDNISLGVWAEKGSIAIATFAERLYWFGLIIVLAIPSMFAFLIAQYYGAKQFKNEQEAVKASILFSTITSVVIAILIMLWGDKIITYFIKPGGQHDYQVAEAFKYVKIFAWLIVLEGIVQSYIQAMYAEGKLKQLMYILMSNIVLNAILNYVFMKALDFGRIGSAWSTLISWSITLFILVLWIFIMTKRNQIHFSFNIFTIFMIDLHISRKAFKRIGVGISTLIAELTIILTMTAFSRNYESGGTITAMINPFFNLIMFAGSGIASTKSFFVGKNLGAGKFQKAYEYDVKINVYALWLSILNSFLIVALAYPLPLIYTKEASESKLTATYALLIIALSYPFVIMSNALKGSLIQGGKGKEVFLASSIQPLILDVGVIWLIAALTPATFILTYIAYRIFKSSKVIIIYLFWRKKDWITNETGLDEEMIKKQTE